MPYTNDPGSMDLHHPFDGYKNIYKDLHHKNVTKKLESLVEQSQVNILENKSTVKDIRAKEKVRDNLAKTIRNQNSLKTFLIVLNIILVVVAIFSVYQLSSVIDHLLSWILLPVSIILFILFRSEERRVGKVC